MEMCCSFIAPKPRERGIWIPSKSVIDKVNDHFLGKAIKSSMDLG